MTEIFPRTMKISKKIKLNMKYFYPNFTFDLFFFMPYGTSCGTERVNATTTLTLDSTSLVLTLQRLDKF